MDKKTLIIISCVIMGICASRPELSAAELNTMTAQMRESNAGIVGEESTDLSELQKQARLYRNQGFQYQSSGDFDRALAFYQKAIQLDPAYAVVYNDLGVSYETKGLPEKAEELYLKAIHIDPYYLSAYSNLAALAENKGDFEKAAYYWHKRYTTGKELGLARDAWTIKAKERLEQIGLTQGGYNEYQLIDFMREVARKKQKARTQNSALAQAYMDKAKIYYIKEDYSSALKEAVNAQQLDPSNQDIEEFIDKAQIRLFSR
ncbi:MAG: tetratricopeptide repeat protein [Candidatus Omnitrophica bacterium]|nr:tetratricopeptide repeat protein [Candidatus Omnitrophota bacterium]